jgi:hypothetical protein
MICYECGGTCYESTDPLEAGDKYIGKLTIEGLSHLVCEGCGSILYPPETARKIDAAKKARMQELIRRFPLDNFINTHETIDILGITKQALSKNKRISKGFIYSMKIGNIILYLKKSVLLYKSTGDGRFPLYQAEVVKPNLYSTSSIK